MKEEMVDLSAIGAAVSVERSPLAPAGVDVATTSELRRRRQATRGTRRGAAAASSAGPRLKLRIDVCIQL